jgi:hypothetical protein
MRKDMIADRSTLESAQLGRHSQAGWHQSLPGTISLARKLRISCHGEGQLSVIPKKSGYLEWVSVGPIPSLVDFTLQLSLLLVTAV